MNEQDLQNLTSLLGESFTPDEVKTLLGEFPELLDSASGLQEALEFLRSEPIPSLAPDFTQRLMARLNAPSLWQRWFGKGAWPLRVGLASAMAALLVAGIYYYYPSRPPLSQPFPPMAQQGAVPHGEKIYQVKFSINRPEAQEVSLMGDFTQWERIVLAKDAAGNFSAELTIPQGTYAYGFVVDGKEWVPDQTAHGFLPDGFGRINSVIHL